MVGVRTVGSDAGGVGGLRWVLLMGAILQSFEPAMQMEDDAIGNIEYQFVSLIRNCTIDYSGGLSTIIEILLRLYSIIFTLNYINSSL